MTPLECQAAWVETESLFGRDDWLTALIDGHPDRDALLRIIHEAVSRQCINPGSVATNLLAALREFIMHEEAVNQLASTSGTSADELPALAEGMMRLSAGRDDSG